MASEHKTKMQRSLDTAAEITDAAMRHATMRLQMDLDNNINPNQRAEVFALATIYAQTAAAVYTKG